MAVTALRPDLQPTTTFVASLAGLEKPYLSRNSASPKLNACSNSGTGVLDITEKIQSKPIGLTV